jgi:hypothetical protein
MMLSFSIQLLRKNAMNEMRNYAMNQQRAQSVSGAMPYENID